jgi:hypothetical protein
VYVQPFAGRGRWQISSGGGFAPVWNRRERSLLFKTPDKFIMVSSYSTRGDLFVPEKPRLWAAKPLPESHLGQDFDFAPDGKRLAVQVLAPEPEERQPGIHVNFLINFFDELRRRVAAENR